MDKINNKPVFWVNYVIFLKSVCLVFRNIYRYKYLSEEDKILMKHLGNSGMNNNNNLSRIGFRFVISKYVTYMLILNILVSYQLDKYLFIWLIYCRNNLFMCIGVFLICLQNHRVLGDYHPWIIIRIIVFQVVMKVKCIKIRMRVRQG